MRVLRTSSAQQQAGSATAGSETAQQQAGRGDRKYGGVVRATAAEGRLRGVAEGVQHSSGGV